MAQTISGLLPGGGDSRVQVEKCLFGNCEVELPISLLEDANIFMEVMSLQTWQSELSDSQKRHLIQFLPTFPKSDMQEKQLTLRKVFANDNVKFGTPLRQFHVRLKGGNFSPDIVRIAALCRKARMREYRYQQQVYYSNLLKDILVNRQRLLEQVYQTPLDEPLQLRVSQYISPREKPQAQSLPQRVQRRYARILQEVNDECCAETSDEDELVRSSSDVKVQPRPVCRPLFPESPSESAAPSAVVPTFAPKPHTINGGMVARAAPRTLIDFTEDDYRDLLTKHRKRKADGELHPELETGALTLQDIVCRTMPAKKALTKTSGVSTLSNNTLLKKKLKEKSDKRKKKIKVKEEGEEEGEEAVTVEAIGEALVVASTLTPPPAVPVCEVPLDDSLMDGIEPSDETDSVTTLQTISQALAPPPPGQQANFFSLLRDFICEDKDGKTTTTKLEERVRDWQETGGPACSWFVEQANWAELVAPALKFLSGDVLGLTLENFIPLLDYKERAQQWKWIGRGRDADEQLHPLCRHWLENKDEAGLDAGDGNLTTPPAPKLRTAYVVKPTNDEEKSLFQKQEHERFGQPHQAFTYLLHGYSSVVGPVKGVYAKESTMNKARDHVLLVKDRPPYVTILTLVRDAAARLPNGEGTRGNICELLKDSQFLAEGVTDAQINNVVSGALDRLHYEKDPCVKYDVNRKLWIYLHRNRTEDEFEKIHQAQGAAAKAKKALQKPKPAKKIKESVAGATSATSLPDSPLRIEPPSPSGASVSPRAQVVSPRTPQMSPRAPTQATQISPRTPAQAAQLSPRAPSQPSPKLVSSSKQPQSSPKVVVATTASTGPLTGTTPRMSVASALAKAVSGKPVIATVPTVNASPVMSTAKPSSAGQTMVHAQQVMAAVAKPTAVSATVASQLSLSQQLAVSKAAAAGGVTMIGGAGTAKPLSLTFLHPPGTKTTTPGAPLMTASASASASKPLAFSLIQSPLTAKVSGENPTPAGQVAHAQTRTVVLTSKGGETIGQKLLLTQQQHQQLQQQQQLQQLQHQLQQQAAAGARPVITTPKLAKATRPAQPSSPVTLVTTSLKGSSTKVVQQVASTAPHMVSVPNMGLASVATLQKQMANATTIKIQGGSILQSSGAKPLTIQRMTSLDGSEVKTGQMILQRSQSVSGDVGGEAATASALLQQQVAPGSPQLTISRHGGKPATLVFTKPGSTIAGKPVASMASMTSVAGSLAAQLIQTTSIGGRPVAFGGKPIIIGGKPMQLSGKPIQIGGKPVHLIGKPGGGQIGVIQGQGGMMSALNIVTQAPTGATTVSSLTSVPQGRLINTPTVAAPTLVGQILQSSGGAVVQAGRSAGATTVSASKMGVVSGLGATKVMTPSNASGMMVAQLTASSQAKAGTVSAQSKMVSAAGQASMLGHQILVAPGTAGGKVVNAQQLLAATGGVRPALLTRSPGGKPGPNIQVVKTMLSQASGGKPGQTTIVLAQPGGQQVTMAGVEQLTQAGLKSVSASAAKSKGGPVYARIITPPPGIRLAAVRPGMPTIPGVSMLQTVGARLQAEGHLISQVSVSGKVAGTESNNAGGEAHK